MNRAAFQDNTGQGLKAKQLQMIEIPLECHCIFKKEFILILVWKDEMR